MGRENFLLLCATLAWLRCAAVAAQAQSAGGPTQLPATRFTCRGRVSGYYADVETGCQVYHMCDGLGRQFSYSCPNTTLFQQRMLICDHWYMVNCSMSERDYDANLLIGQRDKPFVSEAEMRLRTPRPDILSVPPNSNYYDGLREAESKFPIHPGNSIVGIADSLSSANNNGLDSAKQNYRPPTSWSTGTGVRPQRHGNSNIGTEGQGTGNTGSDQRPDSDNGNQRPGNTNNGFEQSPGDSGNVVESQRPGSTNQRPGNDNNGFINQRPGNSNTNRNNRRPGNTNSFNNNRPNENSQHANTQIDEDQDNLAGAASLKPRPTFRPTEDTPATENTRTPRVTPPTQELRPPFPPSTTEPPNSEEFELDVRMKPQDDPVYNFIKRFDPNAPDSHKTAMTRSEILNLNEQLPAGQVSAEEERTPRKNKDTGNHFNRVQNENKGSFQRSRFDTVNTKPAPTEATVTDTLSNSIPTPARDLVPPKKEFSEQPSTTMGPPVYYEWKWAAPAFDLEPPKVDNTTASTSSTEKRNISGRSPFSSVTRPTPADLDPIPPTKNTEYNISSYFVPDYIFPLDKAHPGYEDEEAETSFQVKVARPGRASYGENPNCPQCHPAYLTPGTCEPCIVKR